MATKKKKTGGWKEAGKVGGAALGAGVLTMGVGGTAVGAMAGNNYAHKTHKSDKKILAHTAGGALGGAFVAPVYAYHTPAGKGLMDHPKGLAEGFSQANREDKAYSRSALGKAKQKSSPSTHKFDSQHAVLQGGR